jgi:hypothetical protein
MSSVIALPYFSFEKLSFQGSAARRGEVHGSAASANQHQYDRWNSHSQPECVFNS